MTVSDDLSEVVNAAVDSLHLMAQPAPQWLPFGLALYRGHFEPAPGATVTMQRGAENIGLLLPDTEDLAPDATVDDVVGLVTVSLAGLASGGNLQVGALCRQVFAAGADDDRTAAMLWIEHADGPTLRIYVPYVRSDDGTVTISKAQPEPETMSERLIFGRPT